MKGRQMTNIHVEHAGEQERLIVLIVREKDIRKRHICRRLEKKLKLYRQGVLTAIKPAVSTVMFAKAKGGGEFESLDFPGIKSPKNA